ncbi:hypothetical protein M8J76_014777 [Diaphorina citri]|nr:hypothetical protein M8J76_014777 [Diaphorina citri]
MPVLLEFKGNCVHTPVITSVLECGNTGTSKVVETAETSGDAEVHVSSSVGSRNSVISFCNVDAEDVQVGGATNFVDHGQISISAANTMKGCNDTIQRSIELFSSSSSSSSSSSVTILDRAVSICEDQSPDQPENCIPDVDIFQDPVSISSNVENLVQTSLGVVGDESSDSQQILDDLSQRFEANCVNARDCISLVPDICSQNTLAYNNVGHMQIKKSVDRIQAPDVVKKLVIDCQMGNESKFEIGLDKSTNIQIKRGLMQGAPLSPLLYNVATNHLIEEPTEQGWRQRTGEYQADVYETRDQHGEETESKPRQDHEENH